jgi:hypothetical protein
VSEPRSPASALTEAGDWGPFFAVHTHPAAMPPAPPWHSWRDWLDDPTGLAGRVADVRAHLAAGGGAVSVRVAASVTHLGLTARLVSPALAVAVRTGRFLTLRPDELWWQPALGGAFPLSMVPRAADTPAELLDRLSRLVARTRAFSVSERTLWGNVASAINGAATMLGAARPELAAGASAVAATLLDLPPLRATAFRRPDGRFVRRSCCLIYRAAPTGRTAVCGDCVLTAKPG